jgi:anaerobic magnesium-protoporphyrin IX monomethyl ester cyclase
MTNFDLDVLLINPSRRHEIYQKLGGELTAAEPPLWCRLIAGYARDRGFSLEIFDCEAERRAPDTVAAKVVARRPRLVGMIVFSHQPSASTHQMAAAGPVCRAITSDIMT